MEEMRNAYKVLVGKRLDVDRTIILQWFLGKYEYPKVSGLAAWSENCKWYSYLALDALVSLFCESV
jgi:hypothetical protein